MSAATDAGSSMATARRPSDAAVLLLLFLLLARCGFDSAQGELSVLLQGYTMDADAAISQPPYELVMEPNCNLVLYGRRYRVLWASGTAGFGRNCRFTLQSNGNAVLYTGDGSAVFSTRTGYLDDGDHFIIVECDGNVAMYNGSGRKLWQTGTGSRVGGRGIDALLQDELLTLLPHAKHPRNSTEVGATISSGQAADLSLDQQPTGS